MEVVPQNPAVVVVSRRHVAGGGPQHAGVAVYDGGTQRSQTTSVPVYANVIAYSDSPTTLYAFGNESSDFLFHRLLVNGSGVSVQSSTAGLISGFGIDIKYAAGRVYATSGAVVDPAALSVVGTFTGAGLGTFNGSGYGPLVQPDPENGRVYFLLLDGPDWKLRAYDAATFGAVGSLTIPGVTGAPSSLIRWGADGLAFRTSGGQVFCVSGQRYRV